ncbi:MAG: hypothetical protein HC837_15635, partial [Chloroflexaceae bacterium]|nr:hypothetical protein [Chloroflexaceae bacterium]
SILDLASQSNRREALAPSFAAVRERMAWPTVLQPLIAFCQQPHYAPDKHRRSAATPTDAGPHPGPLSQGGRGVNVEPAALTEQRVAELEAVIADKNAHIAHVEDLVQRIQSGRLMRLMQQIQRFGGR